MTETIANGLKPSDIKSERRHKSVATPRAVAMYISRHHTKDSYPDLARCTRKPRTTHPNTVARVLHPNTVNKVLGCLKHVLRLRSGGT